MYPYKRVVRMNNVHEGVFVNSKAHRGPYPGVQGEKTGFHEFELRKKLHLCFQETLTEM